MSWVLPDKTSLPMITMPAVFAMIFFSYRNEVKIASAAGALLR
jgi:hypothetical protein